MDSDWASVRKVLEQADILVIKYSVTDKLAFQQVRNGYAPRLRPLLRHWGVPVILVAVGARLNGEDGFVLCFWVLELVFCFAKETLTTVGFSNTLVLTVEHEDPQESLKGGPVSPEATNTCHHL